ncbi:MAG TPA: type IV pilus twitching motility protein PilT [Thermoanaerobaculaceae bacterium]|nr:type IV pilus twitching motility protein PilT [Thermoanaerobaculaceae bacterium]
MDAAQVMERLVKAARQKGGERLEIKADLPAVLVSGGARLQAGKAVVAPAELEGWLESVLAPERLLAFELGEEVSAVAGFGDEHFVVQARRADGSPQVVVELAPVPAPGSSPAATPTNTATAVGSPAPKPAAKPAAATPAGELERPLDRMLRRLVELGGSDLHLTSSLAPQIRLHGDITALPEFSVPLAAEHILLMCEEVAPGANRGEFRRDNDTDFAYQIAGVARFRANLFRDRRGVAAVFRQIPERLLTFEELGLPECARALCMLNKGLVLVTGPTGSGKSTTLATMVDYANSNRADHIITIEDPIEFVHENKRCLVHQREVFSHTESFKRALRAALREDPDIVLVGELRDLDTMAIAIETAETGHLVFGTLHTTTAISTVDRLIDQFPADRQAQIRVMLAESLKGVIAQILLKRVGGGRVAAYEVLLGVPAVANLIREGKTHQIATIMQTAKRLGMRTMNDALAELVRAGTVDAEEALSKAIDKDGLRGLLKIGEAGGAGAIAL